MRWDDEIARRLLSHTGRLAANAGECDDEVAAVMWEVARRFGARLTRIRGGRQSIVELIRDLDRGREVQAAAAPPAGRGRRQPPITPDGWPARARCWRSQT